MTINALAEVNLLDEKLDEILKSRGRDISYLLDALR